MPALVSSALLTHASLGGFAQVTPPATPAQVLNGPYSIVGQKVPRVHGIGIVDKPGGLNNASAYIGLVPAQRIGVVLLANRGEFPHEIVRYRVLPALARL